MSTCFGCEIQTVYSCLNRTEITENRHQKLKPNRTEKNLNRGSPSKKAVYSFFSKVYCILCGALLVVLTLIFPPCMINLEFRIKVKVKKEPETNKSQSAKKRKADDNDDDDDDYKPLVRNVSAIVLLLSMRCCNNAVIMAEQ